jgi:hypothetical protein
MKKAILIAVFALVGLASFANSTKHNTAKKINATKKSHPTSWIILITCTGGGVVTGGSVCCFTTYQEAVDYINSGNLDNFCSS